MFHTAPPAMAAWDVRADCGVLLTGLAFGGTCVVLRATGLRCPDSVMRVRHSLSKRLFQTMQSGRPGPRRASSLPVLIQS
jgi:hypothetical protein